MKKEKTQILEVTKGIYLLHATSVQNVLGAIPIWNSEFDLSFLSTNVWIYSFKGLDSICAISRPLTWRGERTDGRTDHFVRTRRER